MSHRLALAHAATEGVAPLIVREMARIPWMTMPECVESLLAIGRADRVRLTRAVYNVASFSASAEEVADVIRRHFPAADIRFEPDANRQGIVDTWPADVDCSRAAADWGYRPRWSLEEAFEHYIVPSIQTHYAQA